MGEAGGKVRRGLKEESRLNRRKWVLRSRPLEGAFRRGLTRGDEGKNWKNQTPHVPECVTETSSKGGGRTRFGVGGG